VVPNAHGCTAVQEAGAGQMNAFKPFEGKNAGAA
jgi:hypothetical protein